MPLGGAVGTFNSADGRSLIDMFHFRDISEISNETFCTNLGLLLQFSFCLLFCLNLPLSHMTDGIESVSREKKPAEVAVICPNVSSYYKFDV